MKTITYNLTDNSPMKTISLLMLSITTLLMPLNGILTTMFIFVLLDTVTGIYASIKLNGIKSFKSGKLFNLVVKIFFYMVTIILAFLIDTFIVVHNFLEIPLFLSKAVTVVWIYIEVKSIDENSMKLGNASFWVTVKSLIKKVTSIKKDLSN